MRGVSVNDMILSFYIEYSMYLLVNSGKVYQKFCTSSTYSKFRECSKVYHN